jgi:hypothetical protein
MLTGAECAYLLETLVASMNGITLPAKANTGWTLAGSEEFIAFRKEGKALVFLSIACATKSADREGTRRERCKAATESVP